MNNDKLKQLEQLVHSTNQSNIQLIRNQSVNRLLDYQSVINFISLSIMVMVKSRQYGVWSHGTDTAALRLYESTLSKLWVDYSKGIVMADIETLTHDTARIYRYGTVTGDASARNVQARLIDFHLMYIIIMTSYCCSTASIKHYQEFENQYFKCFFASKASMGGR